MVARCCLFCAQRNTQRESQNQENRETLLVLAQQRRDCSVFGVLASFYSVFPSYPLPIYAEATQTGQKMMSLRTRMMDLQCFEQFVTFLSVSDFICAFCRLTTAAISRISVMNQQKREE